MLAPAPARARRLGRAHKSRASTQQAFGRFFVDLAHDAPEVAKRVVTVSPDVASSTNLGGWINRVGVWQHGRAHRLVRRRHRHAGALAGGDHGQHIELGIAEGNLVGLLGELGATWSRSGLALLPIGTLYDPFVNRALEPWSFGMYAGGQSILVGTPSGVTLAPEGGAHQSIITPSVGLEQPRCVAWEPAFGQDLEWTLLAALVAARARGGTRPISGSARGRSRRSWRPCPRGRGARAATPHALAGGYVLRRAARAPEVTLVGMGAVLPEVIAAAAELADGGTAVDVVCLTSADLVFRALQARQGLLAGDRRDPRRALPADAHRADRGGARRTSAHARIPLGDPPRADREPRRERFRPVR